MDNCLSQEFHKATHHTDSSFPIKIRLGLIENSGLVYVIHLNSIVWSGA